MPYDELIEIGAKLAFRAATSAPELIFNRHVARYFHGIGRRVIVVLTLGSVRIISSKRHGIDQQKPEPMPRDWFALAVGVMVFGTALGITWFAVSL